MVIYFYERIIIECVRGIIFQILRNIFRGKIMLCKVCNSEMVLKIARNGKNAGKSFWGCSNYPHCKYTVDFDAKNKNTQPVVQKIELQNNVEYSEFYASPITDEHEVYFFNTMAVSKKLVENAAYDQNKYNKLLTYTKFRIDLKGNRFFSNEKQQQFFSLILRLLTRGKITYISEISELNLIKRFNSTLGEINERSLLNYGTYKNIEFPNDSKLELVFLQQIIQKIFGDCWGSFVSSQVHLGSLIIDVEDNFANQRVDFLISFKNKHLVVEIDGDEHQIHQDKDNLRDSALIQAGYNVLRIKNEDLNSSNYESLINKIISILEVSDFEFVMPDQNNKAEIALKLTHQFLIVLVKGLETGYLRINDNVKVHGYSKIFNLKDLSFILDLAISELEKLSKAFSNLYGLNISIQLKQTQDDLNKDIFHIGLGENKKVLREGFIKEIKSKDDYFCQLSSFDQLSEIIPEEKSLKTLLQYLYRFNEFQEGQLESIQRLLKRKDTVVLLPTGSGKSLIYQLTSFIVPGITIVIAPITSLMEDQVDNLMIKGIDNAIAIYNESNKYQKELKLKKMLSNNISMIYISPERLQVREFRNHIKTLLIQNSVFTVAIDEAHCVSEWGHDFRTAYLNIGRNSREIFKKHNRSPVIIALTGTASTAVLKDVKREIQITDYEATITPKTFNRKELKFSIYNTSSDNKASTVNELIKHALPNIFKVSSQKFMLDNLNDNHSGIIFCPHVNGDFGVLSVTQNLRSSLGMSVDFYGGTSPNSFNKTNWNQIKKDTAFDFKRNKTKLLVATKAFGMGIDKPNIRYTIHFGIPSSIESYYQEAGRAGRDRNNSECIIVFSNDQDRINDKLLNTSTSLKEISDYVNLLKFPEQDDISRMLYFHVNTFSGIEEELDKVKALVDFIYKDGEDPKKALIRITLKSEEKRNDLEKGIHRLVLLGIIRDYSIDYSSNEFDLLFAFASKEDILNNYLNYVKGYNEGRVKQERLKFDNFKEIDIQTYVLKAAETLIRFIYDTVERGRRRALNEMVQMSKAALKSKDSDSTIRNRIIRYFESTFSMEIDEMLENQNKMLDLCIEIFEGRELENGEKLGGIRSTKDAEELRGQVSKYLESYPDHPGLLFLRSLSELYSREQELDLIINDYLAGIKFSYEKYSKTEKEVLKFIQYYLVKTFDRSNKIYEHVYKRTIEEFNEIKVNEMIIQSDSSKDVMRDLALTMIIDYTNKKIIDILKEE